MTRETLIEKTRSFIMDEEALNFLNLNQKVLTNEKLGEAVDDAVGDWNSTPPFTNKSVDQFSDNQISVLKKKAAIEAVYRILFLHANNRLQYNDQGLNVAEYDNFPQFLQLKQTLEQEYETRKEQMKLAESYGAALGGGVSSEYSLY